LPIDYVDFLFKTALVIDVVMDFSSIFRKSLVSTALFLSELNSRFRLVVQQLGESLKLSEILSFSNPLRGRTAYIF
jgi:hypothetical protein